MYFTRIFVSVCLGVGVKKNMRNGGWAVLCRKLHGFVGRGGPVELGVGPVWAIPWAAGPVFYEDFRVISTVPWT